jgi:hypothetical protein
VTKTNPSEKQVIKNIPTRILLRRKWKTKVPKSSSDKEESE